MDFTPELHDEVVRKAYETIAKLEADRQNGAITAAQYGYGVDVLWSAVAGLVDNEFMTAVELMNEHRKPQVSKLVFLHDQTFTVVRLINDHAGKVTYTTFTQGKNATNRVFDYTQDVNPPKRGTQLVKELAVALLKKGFSLM